MLGNSGKPEISGERRENEVGSSVKVGEAVIAERENERNAAVAAADTNFPASRWPQQETMALLKVRSEMDVAFREFGSKARLWDEVSRRMAELGYCRSAKKCKEKFENIYKYHRRLKNCSFVRSNGKTYRFFDQLEALDHQPISFQTSVPEQVDTAMDDTPLAVTPISSNPQQFPKSAMPISVNLGPNPVNTSTSTTSSSRSESDGASMKKRKWADFFDRLMKSVLEKQEDLQNKFLEAIDKCEHMRQAREEAWKKQEIDRIKREHELLTQERSISAAKDAAILAFLQKVSEQGNCSGQMEENLGQEMSIVYRKENDTTPPSIDPTTIGFGEVKMYAGLPVALSAQEALSKDRKEKDNGENSSLRWPKEEIEALIKIRSKMDLENQKTGPLWEDISLEMKNIGYDRSAKRCKEKWENINKYYRRVKDSNKQRPVGSKTCPYFHLLDGLYNMKSKPLDNSSSSGCNLRPEELLLHMMNHHHSGQPQHEQVVLQQEGKLIMQLDSTQNGNHNHREEVGNEEADGGGDYETSATDPLPVNVMECEGHIANQG